jgi:hypothetical protein
MKDLPFASGIQSPRPKFLHGATLFLELVSKFDSASKEALTLDSQAGLEFSYETHRPAVGQNEEFIAAGKEETPAGPACSRRSSLC